MLLGDRPGPSLAHISNFIFVVADSPGGLFDGLPSANYQQHKPLAGLGTGAAVYYNNKYNIKKNKPTSSVSLVEVAFHNSGVWASLTLAPSPTGCECYSPHGFSVQERHLVTVAKELRPLLHWRAR